MDEQTRQRIERHLRTLLESSKFQRARLQAAALRGLVEAHLEGRTHSTRDLSRHVYGRDDEDFLRATRQLIREIRNKLAVLAAEHGDEGVEFRLHDTRPELRVRLEDADRETARRSRRVVRLRSRAVAVAAAIVLLVFLGGLWAASDRPPPHRIESTGTEVRILDPDGQRLHGWESRLTDPVTERVLAEGLAPREWILGAVLEQRRWPDVRVALGHESPGRAYGVDLKLYDRRRELISRFDLPWFPGNWPDPPVLTRIGEQPIAGDFKLMSVSPIEFDGDTSSDEILVSVIDRADFPCQVLVLGHAEDVGWSVRLVHWNMGHAYAVPLDDLDGDGLDEILIYGQNNTYLQPFLTLLPSSDRERPLVTRSPDGPRQVGIVELSHLPQAGVSLVFPRSVLAREKFPDLFRVRSSTRNVRFDAERGVLRVAVYDGAAYSDKDAALELEFLIDLEQGTVEAVARDYFDYLELLKRRIGDRELEDRWGILETDRLDGFEEDLASQVAYRDDREPEAGWQPLDVGKLRDRIVAR